MITRGESDLIMVGYLDEDGEINVNTYAWSSVLGMLVNGVWIIEKQLATF